MCAGRHASDPGQCVVVAFLGVFESASPSPKRSGCNPTEPVAAGFLTCHPSTEASYIQARPLSRGLKCVSTDMLATFPEDNVSLLLSLGSSRAHPRPPNALDVTRPSLCGSRFPDVPSINGGLLHTSASSVSRPQVCAGRHASDPGQCVVVAFLGVFESASPSPKRSGCNPTEPVVQPVS